MATTKCFRPRRGKKSYMEAHGTVLNKGEMFFEVPESGVGTGECKIKMGDGSTAYSSLPYAIDLDAVKIDPESFEITFTEPSSSTSMKDLLNMIANGSDLSTIIGAIKAILENINTTVENLESDSSSGKVGDTTVGGTAKPIYSNKGVLTALSATVGSTTQPAYLSSGTITAMSGALSTTYGGTGNTSGRSTYSNVTTTNPTSATTYYIPFTTGISSGTNYSLNGNDGVRYNTVQGTTSDLGYGRLAMGNSTAEGTSGNKYGLVRLYGTGANYWTMSGNKANTSNYTLYLPNHAGSLVAASNADSTGNSYTPVYISSSNYVTACSAMLRLSGDTMTGVLYAQSNTSYTTYQVRNIAFSTSVPSTLTNGYVCMVYDS